MIEFAGYAWRVKTSGSAVGPGPNHFSDSPDNVSVDDRGRLHLRITYSEGRWWCAEVINARSLGYGRYSFHLGSCVHDLDPSVVLGLFTWSEDPAYHNREIDIEFSRCAIGDDPTTGQYVIQPYDRIGNLQRITQRTLDSCTYSFDWLSGGVRFHSSSAAPSTWMYCDREVPAPSSEHVRLNLWLHRGAAPANGRRAEVVVDSFTFTPTINR
jgi:hypothetical protein